MRTGSEQLCFNWTFFPIVTTVSLLSCRMQVFWEWKVMAVVPLTCEAPVPGRIICVGTEMMCGAKAALGTWDDSSLQLCFLILQRHSHLREIPKIYCCH